MLHLALLSNHVCRCHVSDVITTSSPRKGANQVVVPKTELHVDKSGPEERSIACPDIHRLCYDLGPKPS